MNGLRRALLLGVSLLSGCALAAHLGTNYSLSDEAAQEGGVDAAGEAQTEAGADAGRKESGADAAADTRPADSQLAPAPEASADATADTQAPAAEGGEAGVEGGLADSAPVGCSQCVEPFPGWTGPVALYEGPASAVPPGCGGADASYVGHGGPGVGMVSCNCGCVSTCGSASVHSYTGQSCQGQVTTLTIPASGCSSVPSGTDSLAVISAGDQVCTPDASVSGSVSWTVLASACPAATAPCKGDGVCGPPPSAFSRGYCIYQAGQAQCPAEYPTAHVYFDTGSHPEKCSGCTCTGAGESCALKAWTAADCKGTSNTIAGCTGIVNLPSISAAPPGCAPSADTASVLAEGSDAAASMVTTFCCLE